MDGNQLFSFPPEASDESEGNAELHFQASPEHRAVVEFLRGKNGPKVRRGILNGKRVDYFKGEPFTALLSSCG